MKDFVKQDNLRALPKFLALVAGFTVLGGIGGFLAAIAAKPETLEAIRAGMDRVMNMAGPWGIPVSGAVLLFPAWLYYRSARRLYGNWDSDMEEGAEDEIRRRMNFLLLLMLLFTNLETVFAFFFLAASFQYTYAPLNVVLFLIAMACIILLQQKVVDLTRSINPEKKGSVYDLKFQKIWFTSCDEAERAQIGQASFQAYRTTTVTCMIVYLVLTLMNFMAGTGLLPVLVVLVIFGALQVSYLLACIRACRRQKLDL